MIGTQIMGTKMIGTKINGAQIKGEKLITQIPGQLGLRQEPLAGGLGEDQVGWAELDGAVIAGKAAGREGRKGVIHAAAQAAFD